MLALARVQRRNLLFLASDDLNHAMSSFGHPIYLSGTYASVNLSFEASYDSGTRYNAVNAVAIHGSTVLTATGALTNSKLAYEVYSPGATNVSVRSTAWTSRSASIRIAPYAIAMDPNPVISGILNGNQAMNNAQWGEWDVLTGGSLGSIGVGGLATDGARGASDANALTGESDMQLLVKPYGLPEIRRRLRRLGLAFAIT